MATRKIGNNGQLLIFLALGLVILGLMVGLALDGGMAYLTHARLSRTVDAAAMAGARELLFGEDKAVAAACDLIAVNGGGVDCEGDGRFSVRIGELEEFGETLPAVFVTGRTSVRTSFMRLGMLFGCDDCDQIPVSALGVGVPPPELDIVLLMDDTKSMREGCNSEQTNGCPNEQERIGAEAFVDVFLPDIPTARIALVPFRGCHNADGKDQCVRNAEVIAYTNDPNSIKGERGELEDQNNPSSGDTGKGIRGLWSQGGSGTNVCTALQEAGRRAGAPELGRRRTVVLLTDADNHIDGTVKWECNTAGSDMDGKTRSAARALKDDGVEIFVLGYGVNGNSDRELAKDIASSTDHYFEALSKDELPAKFEAIARELLKKVRLAV